MKTRTIAAALIGMTSCTSFKDAADVGGMPIATEQASPTSLATDGKALYWTNRGTTAAGFHDGSVQRYALPDGPQTTLAKDQTEPTALFIARGFIYWANAADPDGQIMMASLPDGAPQQIISGLRRPIGLAVDDYDWIYFATRGDHKVYFFPRTKPGGRIEFKEDVYPFVGGTQDSVVAMTLDRTTLYWLNGGNFVDTGALMKGAFGGVVTTGLLVIGGQKNPVGLGVSAAGALYWINSSPIEDGTVQLLERGSQQPTRLAARQYLPKTFLLHDDTMYWTTTSHPGCVADGAVRSLRIGELEVQELPTGGLLRPSALAVDANAVYWADLGCGPEDTSASGTIYRLPR
jgi:hypothetical protein